MNSPKARRLRADFGMTGTRNPSKEFRPRVMSNRDRRLAMTIIGASTNASSVSPRVKHHRVSSASTGRNKNHSSIPKREELVLWSKTRRSDVASEDLGQLPDGDIHQTWAHLRHELTHYTEEEVAIFLGERISVLETILLLKW